MEHSDHGIRDADHQDRECVILRVVRLRMRSQGCFTHSVRVDRVQTETMNPFANVTASAAMWLSTHNTTCLVIGGDAWIQFRLHKLVFAGSSYSSLGFIFCGFGEVSDLSLSTQARPFSTNRHGPVVPTTKPNLRRMLWNMERVGLVLSCQPPKSSHSQMPR